MTTDVERAQRTIDSVFRQRGLSAAYKHGADAPVPCLAIQDAGDRDIEFGAGRPIAEGNTIDVRKSDVAAPVRGGIIEIEGGSTLKIVDDPRSDDPYRLIWTMTVK